MDNLILRFDMRYPNTATTPVADFYQAAIEMGVWAEQYGFNAVGFSEHHNTTDGYRPEEYSALGQPWKRRAALLDENLSVMLKAWSGEPFEYNGTTVQMLPKPFTRPHPLVCIGGNSKPAARRAARFQLPFSPAIDDEELAALYYSECEKHGFKGGFVIMPQHPSTTFIAEDPDQAWHELGEYVLYDALAYGCWRHKNRRAYAESFASNLDELKAEGKYRILTPDQAIKVANSTGSMHFAPLVGGTPPELGWKSLELFARKVHPYLNVVSI